MRNVFRCRIDIRPLPGVALGESILRRPNAAEVLRFIPGFDCEEPIITVFRLVVAVAVAVAVSAER
jgi:hypothetical protein